MTTSTENFNFGMEGFGIGPQVALNPVIINTVAGNGSLSSVGDGGPALNAGVIAPLGVAVDSTANLYIVDTFDNVVREVAADTGIISTVAGISTNGGTGGNDGQDGDGGPAVYASLYRPFAVAVDSAGNLYIADSQNCFIRKVSAATGNISTVVGIGHWVGKTPLDPGYPPCKYSGDGGPATGAELNIPEGLAFDDADDLYIADTYNNVIRRVDAATGIIATVAGNNKQGYAGDGGPATAAELHYPGGVAVDSSGNLFIADEDNNVIRKVAAGSGTITTVAGTGTSGFSGDGGPAIGAELNSPSNISLDSANDLYIADGGNSRIREVAASSGIIATIAGNGKVGFGGDGYDAANAILNKPYGIALDSSGNIYIADTSNNRIRVVNVLASELYFATTPIGFSSLDSPQTATVTDIGNMPLAFSVPANGLNPGISPNFTLSNSSTCPQLDISSSAEFLMPGTSCSLLLNFTPVQTGSIVGTASISDNALSAPPYVQTIHLNGMGLPASAGRPDFSLSVTPSNQTIAQGGTATYTVTVSGIYGFTGAVALAATNVPSAATASFTPASVAVSGASASSTFTVTIPRALSKSAPDENHFPAGNSALRYGLLFFIFPLLTIARKQTEPRTSARKILLIIVLFASLGAAAIGSTGCANIGLEIEPQTYNITIDGTSGNLQRSTTLTLTSEEYVKVKYR